MTKNKKRKRAIRRLAEQNRRGYQGQLRTTQRHQHRGAPGWASRPAAVEHLVRVSGELAEHGMRGPIVVTLRDGEQLFGMELGMTGGNNAPEAMKNGMWRYHGSVRLLDDQGQEHVLNLLDVGTIGPAPSKRERMVELLRERGMLAEQPRNAQGDDALSHEDGESLYLDDGAHIEDTDPFDVK